MIMQVEDAVPMMSDRQPILDNWQNHISINRYSAGTTNIPEMSKLTEDCVSSWHIPSSPNKYKT